MVATEVKEVLPAGAALCAHVADLRRPHLTTVWDGNGGVVLSGKGQDGKEWRAEFHHVAGQVFTVVDVQGSTGMLRTLSRSSRGLRYTIDAVVKEVAWA